MLQVCRGQITKVTFYRCAKVSSPLPVPTRLLVIHTANHTLLLLPFLSGHGGHCRLVRGHEVNAWSNGGRPILHHVLSLPGRLWAFVLVGVVFVVLFLVFLGFARLVCFSDPLGVLPPLLLYLPELLLEFLYFLLDGLFLFLPGLFFTLLEFLLQ